MTHVRGTVKLAALAGLTAALYVIHRITVPLLRLCRRRVTAARASSRLFRTWARSASRILGMRIEVEGPAPSPPFFLVANHLSYVDVVALGSVVDCVFVARGDVARWPLLGRLCRTVGTIFIDRRNKRDIPRVLALIQENLSLGRGIVVFPEGTSSEGATVLPFNPSLLEAAARAGIPVSYASLSYETPPSAAPARLAVCWWGDMKFTGHLLGLFRLPGFLAKITFGQETMRERSRKELASKVRQAVLRRLPRVAF